MDQPIKVFNRLSGNKEVFKPVQSGQVGMYICGMTVQDRPHIGHMRSFVTGDMMRRYLEFRGYDVKHVQNFTDVDDKIIRRANAENVDYSVIAERYIDEYYKYSDALNLKRAHVYPRATQEIDAIIALIERLIERDYAYEAEGDVFFSVDAFPKYGELSGRKTDELMTGTRFEVDPKKRSPLDFAVWKAAKPDEPSWKSPWGMGRPGWHIECSAMSMKYLGETLDMHGGGLDLIFPHHENEKAQAESATGVPFVKYWVESGLLNTAGEKMSKSLGNFAAIGDLLEKYSANIIRYFLLSKHYRSPMEFSEETLEEARKGYGRIAESVANAVDYLKRANIELDLNAVTPDAVEATSLNQFIEAMDDDFNTALAVSHIFSQVKQLNTLLQSTGNSESVQALLQTIAGQLNLLGFTWEETPVHSDHESFDQLMERVLNWRQALRADKNWKMADQIRDDLSDMGIVIEDRPDGSVWKWHT